MSEAKCLAVLYKPDLVRPLCCRVPILDTLDPDTTTIRCVALRCSRPAARHPAASDICQLPIGSGRGSAGVLKVFNEPALEHVGVHQRGGARIAVVVDAGFVVSMEPASRRSIIPAWLDLPAPRMRAPMPSRRLSPKNSRPWSRSAAPSAGFYDIWILTKTFDFTSDRYGAGHCGDICAPANRNPSRLAGRADNRGLHKIC